MKLRKEKKAVELAFETIVKMIILVIVLIILFVFISKYLGGGFDSIFSSGSSAIDSIKNSS